jgi:hypothetical protein
MPIYKKSLEEARLGAVFPGIEASSSTLQLIYHLSHQGRASRMRVPFTMGRRSSKPSPRYGAPALATSHIRSKEKRKCGWVERISYDTLPMVKGRRYNVDSSVTSCLKVFATSFAKIMGKNA